MTLSSLGNGDMFVQSAPAVKDLKSLCLIVNVTCSKCTQGHSLIICNFCVSGCSLYSFFYLSPSILHYLREIIHTALTILIDRFFYLSAVVAVPPILHGQSTLQLTASTPRTVSQVNLNQQNTPCYPKPACKHPIVTQFSPPSAPGTVVYH